MAYELSNGHVTDDVACPRNVLRDSTVGYPSDNLASCYLRDAMLERVFAFARATATYPSFCPSRVGIVLQESHAVAGKPRDAAVNSDRRVLKQSA